MATTNCFGEKNFSVEDYLEVSALKFDKKRGVAFGFANSGVGKRARKKGVIANVITRQGKDEIETKGILKFDLEFFENFDFYMGLLGDLKKQYDAQVDNFVEAELAKNADKIIELDERLRVALGNIETIKKVFAGREISDKYKAQIADNESKVAVLKAEIEKLDPNYFKNESTPATTTKAASKKPAKKPATKKTVKK